MAKTRRDLLREKRDRQSKKEKKTIQPKDTQTSVGFMKGGLMGAVLGLAIGVATKQKAFWTVAGFLTGGYIAENVKRMKERENETNPKFVNYNGRKRR
jgi:uncharacterized protein YcfJ